MLVAGNAKGRLKIKLESFDSVNGHPCGVFSVAGDFVRKQFPYFDGSVMNEEVTVESGKFWLSMLYPIILREETNVIQTSNRGGQGGLAVSLAGSAKVSVVRDWRGATK